MDTKKGQKVGEELTPDACSANNRWAVYILRSETNGKLYTGITTDINRRLHEHNTSAKGAKSTRSGRPWVLVRLEIGLSHTAALRKEAKIKGMPRKRKLLAIPPNS